MTPCLNCKKNMEYREKHKAAQQLQNNNYIEHDRALLKKYNPHSSLHSRSIAMRNGESLSFEIVFQLLDFTSPEEILANRNSFAATVTHQPSWVQQIIPDKKKDSPSLKSFQKSIGKISQMLMFKKPN